MNLLQPYMDAIKIGLALILLVVLTACVLAYNEHERGIGRTEVQQAWDQANTVATAARNKRAELVRKEEAALRTAADQDRKKINDRKNALDVRVAALTRQLRERPDRPADPGPADVPAGTAGTGPAGACTGARLYRDDGVFLIGQARMCQDIRLQRDDYFEKYERARTKLKALGQEP